MVVQELTDVKFKNFDASGRYIKGALSIVEFNVETVID